METVETPDSHSEKEKETNKFRYKTFEKKRKHRNAINK